MRIVVIGEAGDSAHEVCECRERLQGFVKGASVEVGGGCAPCDALAFDDVRVDLVRQTASRGDLPLELDPVQFRFLACLMGHLGQVVSRAELLRDVWHLTVAPQTTILETTVSRLRAKLDAGRAKSMIQTVKGKGYRIG